MYAVHRMHIGSSEPFHRGVEFLHHLVIVEELAGYGGSWRRDLVAGVLVAAAVDSVEQRFGEIDARTEELHMLSEFHRRHATRNTVIVSPEGAHQVIVFVLQRRRVAAALDAKP